MPAAEKGSINYRKILLMQCTKSIFDIGGYGTLGPEKFEAKELWGQGTSLAPKFPGPKVLWPQSSGVLKNRREA